MKPDKWASEAEMMAAFVVAATSVGFRCVPEAGGHDLLLVAVRETSATYTRHSIEPGDVIAVEGKLRDSLTVLRQAMPRHRTRAKEDRPSADFYAVVVPSAGPDFREVADALDILVWQFPRPIIRPSAWPGMNPARPPDLNIAATERYRCLGHPRIQVTDLDVDITPGMPSPRALTPWKLAAVKLCLLGLTRELTSADFKDTPVAHRTFTDNGWMRLTGRDGRQGRYALTDHPRRPDLEYPEIVAAIVAKTAPTLKSFGKE